MYSISPPPPHSPPKRAEFLKAKNLSEIKILLPSVPAATLKRPYDPASRSSNYFLTPKFTPFSQGNTSKKGNPFEKIPMLNYFCTRSTLVSMRKLTFLCYQILKRVTVKRHFFQSASASFSFLNTHVLGFKY